MFDPKSLFSLNAVRYGPSFISYAYPLYTVLTPEWHYADGNLGYTAIVA